MLLESGALTGDQLARATAERFGLYHVDLPIYKPDLGALNLISAQAARRSTPRRSASTTTAHLLVAMVGSVERAGARRPQADDRPRGAPGGGLARTTSHGLIGRMSRLDDAVAEAVEEDEEELAAITEIRESAEDAPVIKLVNSIIAQAVEDGASDIHFEPDGREMRVRFRVDGVLRETTTSRAGWWPARSRA